MANPFTTMRQNIEAALAAHAGLAALSVKLRKWDTTGVNQLDKPSHDRERWVRVEGDKITNDPFWANAMQQSTQMVRIVAALPIQAGKKLEDIEDLVYQLIRALAGLSRDVMSTNVPSVERFQFVGGDLGLLDADLPDENRSTDDVRWVHVASIEIIHQFAQSDLVA